MPQVPIIMPQLGESIAEATVVDVKVKPGDEIAADQEIIEVETNKAVMGVTTPCKGKIDKITAQVKETYPVGTVLAHADDAAAADVNAGLAHMLERVEAVLIGARGDDGAVIFRRGVEVVVVVVEAAAFEPERLGLRQHAERRRDHVG